jgi:hypothetical protein
VNAQDEARRLNSAAARTKTARKNED